MKLPWKLWYNTARWQRLRLQVFKRDLYTCQCGCGMIEGNTFLLVCDHKIPRGDERLFWGDYGDTAQNSRHAGDEIRSADEIESAAVSNASHADASCEMTRSSNARSRASRRRSR